MKRNNDNTVVKKYNDEEPQFVGQELFPENVADLQRWIDKNQLEGLIDEEQGGIIGYINRAHIERIAGDLNNYQKLKDSNAKLLDALEEALDQLESWNKESEPTFTMKRVQEQINNAKKLQ